MRSRELRFSTSELLRGVCGHGPAHGVEQRVELAAHGRSKPVPALPVCGRGAGRAVQHACLTHEGFGNGVGLRDAGQFGIEHAGEGEQGVALVLQRDAHRADASCIRGLAARQLLDDEVNSICRVARAGPASARTSWRSHAVSVRMSRASSCAQASAWRASASGVANSSSGLYAGRRGRSWPAASGVVTWCPC